jgi:hypothetical protein
LYELDSSFINTSHYTSIMLTYSADHEPVKGCRSENEMEPDVGEAEEQGEEEEKQVVEESGEMEVEEEEEQAEEESEEMEVSEEETEEPIAVEEGKQVEEEVEETIVVDAGEQVEEETEDTIVVEERARRDDEPESITTALLYYPDPKNSPNPLNLSRRILTKPRCRGVGGTLHDRKLRRSRALAKSPIVKGDPERATRRSSWRSTPWSTLLNSSEAPRI